MRSLGPITLDQQTYLVVAPDSPIGKQLLGKKAGEQMVWRGEQYVVVAVQ